MTCFYVTSNKKTGHTPVNLVPSCGFHDLPSQGIPRPTYRLLQNQHQLSHQPFPTHFSDKKLGESFKNLLGFYYLLIYQLLKFICEHIHIK